MYALRYTLTGPFEFLSIALFTLCKHLVGKSDHVQRHFTPLALFFQLQQIVSTINLEWIYVSLVCI